MKICNECETVAHCMKYGCVPKQQAPVSKDEALDLALAALFSYEDDYVDDGEGGITSSFCYDKDAVNKAITAIRQALAAPFQNIEHCIWARNGNTPCPHTTQPAALLQPMMVDCIGLALDLEAQAKHVESQTTERAMLSAAYGLRIIAAHCL